MVFLAWTQNVSRLGRYGGEGTKTLCFWGSYFSRLQVVQSCPKSVYDKHYFLSKHTVICNDDDDGIRQKQAALYRYSL